MKYKYLFNFLSFLIIFNIQSLLINLENKQSNFILETKQIEVPGYKFSFNPSIIKWKNLFLMSFRIRDKDTSKIGLTFLNKDFEVIGNTYVLNVHYIKQNVKQRNGPKEQDPRLIKINNKLFIVYNHYQVGKMFVGEIKFNGKQFFINSECLIKYENSSNKRIEKNWVPFEYMKNLLLAYSISPHKIFKPKLGTFSCTTFSNSFSKIPWKYGEIRGGTPALIVDNKYLAFFHSSIDIQSVQSKGKKIRHYFIGAYTFDLKPPFNITHVSPEPIIHKSFYISPEYKTWKPLKAIFPGGFIFNKKYIWIFFGKQDYEIWFAKLDKEILFKSLIDL